MDRQTYIKERVTITEAGCWEWNLLVMPNGYGRLTVSTAGHKKGYYSHRVSYEAFVGPIPTGLDIDHLCRNRRCCNPDHLEPVTRAENLRRGANKHGRKVVAWAAPRA